MLARDGSRGSHRREDTQRLATHLRPLVEAGEGVTRLAVAYLRASW
jgi:hypothetical protein